MMTKYLQMAQCFFLMVTLLMKNKVPLSLIY